MDSAVGEVQSVLVDLGEMRLADLKIVEGTRLADALRRLIEDDELASDQPHAAFESAI
jgi:FXSXX-COOH protein